MSRTDSAINLIQVTDCHLFGDPNDELLGIKTCASLDAVAANISCYEPTIDALLVTGDITQDNSSESYKNCFDTLVQLTPKQIWLYGNHDDSLVLQNSDYAHLFCKKVTLGNWQILALNSQVNNKVYGEISPAELQWLTETLAETKDLNTLIVCHHHPVAVNSAWMDKIILRNGQQLLKTLGQFDHVKLLIHGHIHQEMDRTIDGLRIFSTPSTCVQFYPESPDFRVDAQQPGYRRITLYPDGRFETIVRRLAENTFLPDINQPGY